MEVSPDLSLNPRADVKIRVLGHERQPLVVIDHALSAPGDMVALAAHAPFRAPQTLYPGRHAPSPPIYTQNLSRVLRPLLDQVFGIPADIALRASSFFALAQASPVDLQPVQKVPHHDSNNPFMIAMVHYLCHDRPDAPQGGTAFFRHAATGHEYIDEARFSAYEAAMRAELQVLPPTGYAGPHSAHYEMIDSVDCVYNRLILYRSTSLHSGLLEASTLTDDPLSGRLTLNTLIEPAPKPA